MREYFLNMSNHVDNIVLDNEQIDAITSDYDNTIILAGAGAGKTTTITAKVKYLVDKCNIKCDEILLLSFTNKAVNELKERLNDYFDIDIKVKTFHSLGYEIIRNYNSSIKIINDSNKILLPIIEENKSLSSKKEFMRMNIEKNYKDWLTNIIKLIKTKNISKEYLLNKCNNYSNLINYIYLLIDKYNEKMNSINLADYDDLILKANEVLKQEKIYLPYKYIIVDEFQDISPIRFNLVNTIKNNTGSKLLVVGDDWQSIYSFSGTDPRLFKKLIDTSNTHVLKITKTYRNSQTLINIAGKFVMKSKIHIKKKLKSSKKLKNPIEIIYYNDFYEKTSIISLINKIVKENNITDYAILSRYNHDLKKFSKHKFPGNYEFMSVHQSKGLGFNNVIIIKMSNDKYGFPSNIKNDYLTSLIIDTDFYIEERRLFYVALTRTKNKVYILVPKFTPSSFINEIIKYKGVKIKKY